MTKSELMVALSQEMALPLRKSEEIVNAVFDTMVKTLEDGNRIEIRGFGSFMVKKYQGYTGRNPKTGQIISVTDKKLPFFKAGKEIKDKVSK